MSNAFRLINGKAFDEGKFTISDMRKWCQRPGKVDKDGNIIYVTEQAHKDMCDVNKIIKRYDKTGLISHVSKIEAKIGDLTGDDFKAMSDQIIEANNMFDKLPSEIRNRFRNNPEELLRFMEDPNNRDEAISLGLIAKTWKEHLDGLGEHVVRDDKGEVKTVDGEKVEPETPE